MWGEAGRATRTYVQTYGFLIRLTRGGFAPNVSQAKILNFEEGGREANFRGGVVSGVAVVTGC